MRTDPLSEPSSENDGIDYRTSREIADDVVARVLARGGSALDEGGTRHTFADGDQMELEARTALRRVSRMSPRSSTASCDSRM